jgi:hypothetical protein
MVGVRLWPVVERLLLRVRFAIFSVLSALLLGAQQFSGQLNLLLRVQSLWLIARLD